MTMQLASPFSGLSDYVEEHVPLAKFTWYKIGGPARWFIRPRSLDELRGAMARCAENGIPVYVHAPYLVNFGSPSDATLTRSVAAVEHALRRWALARTCW